MAMASAEHCCHNPNTRNWCLHCVGELEAEIARLRAGMEVFADPESWKFDSGFSGWESSHEDQWVWGEPWIETGAILFGDYKEKKPIENPAEFARKALDGKP